MKKAAILMAVAAAVLISVPAWAQHIVGSPHDLSVRLGTGEVCLSCHVPHNPMNPSYGPLWNHALTNGTGTGFSKTLYGPSLLCMGCHDGVTAVGNFGVVNKNITVNDTTDPIQGLAGARTVQINGTTVYVNDIGLNLTYVHPVGTKYPALNGTSTSSSFNLSNPSTSGYGGTTVYTVGGSYTGTTLGGNYITLEAGSVSTTQNYVGCTTCHNPHDDTTAPPFLVFSNAGSALCLTCHIR